MEKFCKKILRQKKTRELHLPAAASPPRRAAPPRRIQGGGSGSGGAGGARGGAAAAVCLPPPPDLVAGWLGKTAASRIGPGGAPAPSWRVHPRRPPRRAAGRRASPRDAPPLPRLAACCSGGCAPPRPAVEEAQRRCATSDRLSSPGPQGAPHPTSLTAQIQVAPHQGSRGDR